ncbi:glycosyl hydrolase [Blautia schinkii]|nr:glycosyl hydrolase [Blautia schinkii]
MLYKKTKELTPEVFRQPGSEYRAAPFWAWNCKMTKEKVDHTLNYLKEMGMGGGHVHCRTGMDNSYMGEEFLSLVKYTNEKCKEKDMLTWLYDEDRWPSGAGGGLVTKDHEYRIRFLLFTPERQEGKDIGMSELRSSGQAVRSNERTFLGRYQVKLVGGYLKDYEKIAEDASLSEGYQEWFAYEEVSGDNPWFNNEAYLNTLDKKAVERFIEVTHEKYYELLGDEFSKSVPAIFTDEPQFSHKTCLGFAGERVDVTIPYTDDLEDTFREAYGHSLLESLPELFWELGEDKVSRIRYEYHDHIAERFASAFADTVGGWCQKHGIALTGHMMEEPTLETQTAALGEAMRSYRSFDIPGVDMLCDRRELSTAKQTQSAVHQYGREGMLSELYGVTHWDFDFRGHKLQGDWQAALGVTVRVPHLTWTSMAGEAKRDYPAAIGYQSPWYKEYPLIEDYFARVNTVLTRGVPHVRLGVIHPIESYWLFWGPKEQTAAVREEMDDNFAKLIKWLLYGTIDFDFIAESLLPELNEGQQEDCTLKAGCMNYDVVLVPNCKTLRSSTLEILEKFRERGGRVIFAGELPSLADAYPSDRGKELAHKSEIIPFSKQQLLKALRPIREVEIKEADGSASGNLIYQMREEGENRWLFLAHVNRTQEADSMAIVIGGVQEIMKNEDLPFEEKLKISIAGEWKPTVYDAMSGEIRELACAYEDGNTVLHHTLYDHDSLLLLLEPGRREDADVNADINTASKADAECGYVSDMSSTSAVSVKEIPIPSMAEIILSELNVSILDLAKYRFDDGEWESEEEILRIDNKFREKLGYPLRMEAFAQPWTNDRKEGFEHTLSLRYTIEAETELCGVRLAMENDETTKVFLDGAEVENRQTGWYVDHCIHTTELPVISEGTHCLQVEIPYNSKVNVEAMFLLGDFSVQVQGRKQTLAVPKKTAAFADITRQGFPFYGGNITYRVPFESEGGEVRVQATMYRAPVMKAALDGKDKGYLVFSPYEINLGTLEKGSHTLELTVFGSRINTFGTLHNCDQKEIWYGPNAWRTTGDQWAYEYQLKPAGILKAPVLTETK